MNPTPRKPNRLPPRSTGPMPPLEVVVLQGRRQWKQDEDHIPLTPVGKHPKLVSEETLERSIAVFLDRWQAYLAGPDKSDFSFLASHQLAVANSRVWAEFDYLDETYPAGLIDTILSIGSPQLVLRWSQHGTAWQRSQADRWLLSHWSSIWGKLWPEDQLAVVEVIDRYRKASESQQRQAV